MADVYAVMRNGQLLGFSNPTRKRTWLKDCSSMWKVYYYSCECAECQTEKHQVLINYVIKADCVSIGFEHPVVVDGRMVTWNERNSLQSVLDWLKKRNTYLPAKVTRHIATIEKLLKVCTPVS